jgi:hypothetical protein
LLLFRINIWKKPALKKRHVIKVSTILEYDGSYILIFSGLQSRQVHVICGYTLVTFTYFQLLIRPHIINICATKDFEHQGK